MRTIYCEMLGYEASFSYIHAIKLAQQGTVLEKRVGMLFQNLLKGLNGAYAVPTLCHIQSLCAVCRLPRRVLVSE